MAGKGLSVDLDVGEGVEISGSPATVTFERKTGRKVRLNIVANKSVALKRVGNQSNNQGQGRP
jgi:hypothetical protein